MDPINQVKWLPAVELDGNDYNPNMVMTPELRLLERSILLTGWVQPILITRDRIIIDGFHRWRLALDSSKLKARYNGLVPCAELDVDRATAMIMTVRMNRAKGVHAAFRMSAVIKELVDQHGVDLSTLAQEIGATKDEINLLYQEGVFSSKNIDKYKYSDAWYPAENGKKR
jgi:ParB-like chromosome segregation protein Spo0J